MSDNKLSAAEYYARSEEERKAKQQERDARRDEDVAAHKEAVEASQVEEVEFLEAGYAETLPGQIEIVAGSVPHEQVLNSYKNATSYGPEHNVVVAEPEPPPEPPPEGGVTQREGGEYADQQR